MADRPRNDGSGEAGPEFGWLYGSGKGSGQGRAPGPDETRVMPVQPRPAAGGGTPPRRPVTSSPSPAPAPAPVRRPAPAPAPAPRGGGRGRRLPRIPKVLIPLLVLVLPLVYLVGIPLLAWSKVDKIDWQPDGDRPADQPGTTYLLVGNDSRGDLSAAERKQLGTGAAAGQRTDTIMLLHTGAGPNLLMSIPRDSNVEVPGRGTTKINAAYAFGGPKLLTRTIENETGIRVDHYVEVGFGGFVDVVDAVGGIEICPEKAMVDKQAKLDVKAGCQEADGVTALGYARSRKTYTQLGDIQRAQAQREVVGAIGDKVLSPWSVLNPFRYYGLTMAATQAVGFGEGTGMFDAARWAWGMTRVNGDKGLTCGVPIRDLSVNWDEERSGRMFDAIIEDRTDDLGKDLCSPSGLPRSVTG